MKSTTETKEYAVDGRLFRRETLVGLGRCFRRPSECLNLGKGSTAARSKRLIRKPRLLDVGISFKRKKRFCCHQLPGGSVWSDASCRPRGNKEKLKMFIGLV